MVKGNKIRINLKPNSEDAETSRRERSPVSRNSEVDSNYRDRSSERSKGSANKRPTPYSDEIYSQDKQHLEKDDITQVRGRTKERSDNIEGEDEDESDGMLSLMGFSGFGTTKGKHVNAAKGGALKKEKSSEYRQYMNRAKGFNRPLSPKRNK